VESRFRKKQVFEEASVFLIWKNYQVGSPFFFLESIFLPPLCALTRSSFHPNYQFAGTEPADAENFTNRSPYPILHLLREKSLSVAIDVYPNADDIPNNNIKLMNEWGGEYLQDILEQCFN